MVYMKTDRDDFHDWQMSERASISSTLTPLERRRPRTPPLPPEMPWGRIALIAVVGLALLLLALRLHFR